MRERSEMGDPAHGEDPDPDPRRSDPLWVGGHNRNPARQGEIR
jgi:hypothetical protein